MCNEKDAEMTVSSDCSCKDGLPHGTGWMLETGMSITQGQWNLGKKHGLMRFRTRSGMEFRGHYANDKKNGVGWLRFAVGEVVSEHKDNQFDGYGVSTDSTGQSYAGEYQLGKRSGHGVHLHQFGDSYRGEFQKGKYRGCGRFIRGGTIGLFTSKVLGASRDGFWNACNKTAECPLSFFVCRCDMNEQTTGQVPDSRFRQCAMDSDKKALAAQSAALDIKRQAIAQMSEATFPGPGDDFDEFGVLPDDVRAELPEAVVDTDAEEAQDNELSFMGEVALMMLLLVIPNGVHAVTSVTPRKVHIFVYLTAVLIFLCIVELVVGLDFASEMCGHAMEAFQRYFSEPTPTFDNTNELIRRGYLAADAAQAQKEL